MVVPSDSTGEVVACAHCPNAIASVDGTWRHVATGSAIARRCSWCGTPTGGPGVPVCTECGQPHHLVTDHVAEPVSEAPGPVEVYWPAVGLEAWTACERPNGGVIVATGVTMPSSTRREDEERRPAVVTYWPYRARDVRVQFLPLDNLTVSRPTPRTVVGAIVALADEVVRLTTGQGDLPDRARERIGWMHYLVASLAQPRRVRN